MKLPVMSEPEDNHSYILGNDYLEFPFRNNGCNHMAAVLDFWEAESKK